MQGGNWSGGEERLYQATDTTKKEEVFNTKKEGLLQHHTKPGMNLLYAQEMICDHFWLNHFDFIHNSA